MFTDKKLNSIEIKILPQIELYTNIIKIKISAYFLRNWQSNSKMYVKM